jgi:hypothetical protein
MTLRAMSVAKNAWRRLGWMWERFPIRIPGLILLAAALYVTFRFSRESSDYLLYPAGLGAMGLLVVCVLGVTAGALTLRRAVRRLDAGLPDRMETLCPVRTPFRSPRLGRWPLVDVSMRWLEPAGIAVDVEAVGGALEELITPRERGRHKRVTRRFTVEDVFGLTSIGFTVTWETPFAVVPAVAATSAELAASHAQGDSFSHPAGNPDGDLVEMRRYGAGDPLRHVLWKTFARTRRLLVRMPERALAPQPITVAFLVAGPSDEPTAAAARLYLERGILGPDFIFAADGSSKPTRDPREAIDQIIDSAAARGDGGAGLAGLASQVDRSRLTSFLVFAPPVDGPWRARVLDLAQRTGIHATVIVGVDGVAAAPRGRLARLLARPEEGDDPDSRALARLPALRSALEADGFRVQVLHRQTGQLL